MLFIHISVRNIYKNTTAESKTPAVHQRDQDRTKHFSIILPITNRIKDLPDNCCFICTRAALAPYKHCFHLLETILLYDNIPDKMTRRASLY